MRGGVSVIARVVVLIKEEWMSRYKVLPRRTREGSPEKCPVCKMGWVNLMDIHGDGSLLACFVCGCVFVSKTTRTEEAKGIKAQIQQQEAKGIKTDAVKRIETEIMSVDDGPLFKCDICGKLCKTPTGLKVHKVSCKPKADNGG